MFTPYGIAFAQARKPYRLGLLFTNRNSDFGAIFVTERSCAAVISQVESDNDMSDSVHTQLWIAFCAGTKSYLVECKGQRPGIQSMEGHNVN